MRRIDIIANRKEELKQPSKDFTGRMKELAEFGRRAKSGLTEHVWYLHGFGGIGKSDLLKKIRNACKLESLPCAYIDLSTDEAKSEAGLLHEIATELGITELPTFQRCYDRYDRLIKSQPTSVDAISELADIGTSAMSFSPIPTGGLLDRAKERLSSHMSSKDAAFLGQASDELFRALTGDLCDYITSDLRESPVVILFDTYEQASGLQTDILELLILACQQMGLPVMYVIAGQDDPDALRPSAKRSWQNEDVMDAYHLGNLEEAEEYLERRGITHPRLVERILRLTGRFPMFLRMACEVVGKTPGNQAEIAQEFPEERMDEKKVTEYLLERILDRLPEKQRHLRQAVRRLGLARWFNKPILALLMDIRGSEVGDDWDILTHTALVQRHGKAGRWELCEPIREAIISEWRDVQDEPVEYHRKLAG